MVCRRPLRWKSKAQLEIHKNHKNSLHYTGMNSLFVKCYEVFEFPLRISISSGLSSTLRAMSLSRTSVRAEGWESSPFKTLSSDFRTARCSAMSLALLSMSTRVSGRAAWFDAESSSPSSSAISKEALRTSRLIHGRMNCRNFITQCRCLGVSCVESSE